ncbi:hypothetical protein ACGF12_35765 [Kitasatospora sp. NPDC048296]
MSSTGYGYEVEPCDPEFVDGRYEEAREQLAALGIECRTDEA